jgi:hypothetical protein
MVERPAAVADEDLARAVEEVLAVDRSEFVERVREEATELKRAIQEGTFDNPQPSVGLEYELYGVDGDGGLQRLPASTMSHRGFDVELGVHNAELQTAPQPLNRPGIDAQLAELQSRVSGPLADPSVRLVSDGMWTIPPAGETARSYLSATTEVGDVVLTDNMTPSGRYQAFLNTDYPSGRRLSVPGTDAELDTILTESLTTSIQPHYQVPDPVELPTYFGDALRVAGPVLALTVNSPFLPPDLYEDADPETVLAGHDESRIAAFEGTMNAPDRPPKVRFPEDVDSVAQAVDRVVEDDVIVPARLDPGERYDTAFRHFRHKHGSYWRWVRPVFGGATPADANVRIEFRPVPAQPTLRDSVAVLATVAGALRGLATTDHPVSELAWTDARENFRAAVEDGIDAEITWVDRSGETVTGRAAYEDLLAVAHDGLVEVGLSPAAADDWLRPMRARVRHWTTPADWKRRRVRDRLDAGDGLAEAIQGAQRAYVDAQRDTLLSGTFTDWIAGRVP